MASNFARGTFGVTAACGTGESPSRLNEPQFSPALVYLMSIIRLRGLRFAEPVSSRGHHHRHHHAAQKTNENNIIKTVKKNESNESPHQRNRRLAPSSCNGWHADYKAATKSRSGRVLCVALVHHTQFHSRGAQTAGNLFIYSGRHARITEYKSRARVPEIFGVRSLRSVWWVIYFSKQLNSLLRKPFHVLRTKREKRNKNTAQQTAGALSRVPPIKHISTLSLSL